MTSVIDEAATWLRTPWEHQQRVKGAGVDCVMLLCEVYAAAGLIPRVEPEYYPVDIMLHREGERIIPWLEKFADEVTAPEEGDVVVYKFGHWFSHAGIVIDTENIIHAFQVYGQVVKSRIDEGKLADRPRRYFRMRGQDERASRTW